MSSVFEKPGRSKLYATVRDPVTLKWRSIATPYDKDSPAARRNALLWANERDQMGLETRKAAPGEAWGAWVPAWLTQTFSYNRGTLQRYQTAWAHLFEFLVDHKIPTPRLLHYRHAAQYVTWRTDQKRRRGTLINHNTAVTEIRVLSRILREARLREFIDVHPWTGLQVRRQEVRHTPAMDLDEISKIRGELERREGALPMDKRWMTVSFELALHHGARLSSTSVPMSRVWLDPRTTPTLNLDRISFQTKGKNGVPTIKTLPLNPVCRPILEELKRLKAARTCELPKMAAKEWWKLRRDLGLAHLRFHSTRATVATELARGQVSIQKAMELLGHKSQAVHLAYLHLNAADVADAIGGLSFATPSKPGTADAKPPRR